MAGVSTVSPHGEASIGNLPLFSLDYVEVFLGMRTDLHEQNGIANFRRSSVIVVLQIFEFVFIVMGPTVANT